MEKWQEVFKDKIPKAKYQVLLENGEEKGLLINLISPEFKIQLDFGVVSVFRMLDEGIALNNLFKDEAIKDFKALGFTNVIYQITSGEFDNFVEQICGNLYEYLELKHYVIISNNYVIEIITEWEPEIKYFQ
ncbi:hypothetical protein [Anaeropeptidivorans aminofermentans]|uniref:hypothetical protein n=1 Tax=Anaeropeptidivorans aminofermentans TaxID=2934315 RepID=UPI002024BA72|nr:hypothetical protein [Anaeropeptidivorans aminofermentans]